MQVRTNNVEEAAIETASCLPPAIEHTNDDDKSLIKSVKTDGHNLSSGSTSQSRTKDLSEQKEERKHFNSEKGGVASTPESTSTTTEDQEINKVYLCRFSGANSHFLYENSPETNSLVTCCKVIGTNRNKKKNNNNEFLLLDE